MKGGVFSQRDGTGEAPCAEVSSPEGGVVGSGVGSGDGSRLGSEEAITVTFSVTVSSLPSRLIIIFAVPSALALICPSAETEATETLSLL